MATHNKDAAESLAYLQRLKRQTVAATAAKNECVETGKQHLTESRYADAARAFGSALSLDPTDTVLVDALEYAVTEAEHEQRRQGLSEAEAAALMREKERNENKLAKEQARRRAERELKKRWDEQNAKAMQWAEERAAKIAKKQAVAEAEAAAEAEYMAQLNEAEKARMAAEVEQERLAELAKARAAAQAAQAAADAAAAKEAEAAKAEAEAEAKRQLAGEAELQAALAIRSRSVSFGPAGNSQNSTAQSKPASGGPLQPAWLKKPPPAANGPPAPAAGQGAELLPDAAVGGQPATAAPQPLGEYGGPVDGTWVNSKPPPHIAQDMFAEIAWKKKQKNAKMEWEAANATDQESPNQESPSSLARTSTAPAAMTSSAESNGNSAADIAARFAARLNAPEKEKKAAAGSGADAPSAPLNLFEVPLAELQGEIPDGVDASKKVRGRLPHIHACGIALRTVTFYTCLPLAYRLISSACMARPRPPLWAR
jgi:hypothetical protein